MGLLLPCAWSRSLRGWRACRNHTMLLPTIASAVVIKRQPECANDELHGDDDSKEVTGLVGRFAFRIGHDQVSALRRARRLTTTPLVPTSTVVRFSVVSRAKRISGTNTMRPRSTARSGCSCTKCFMRIMTAARKIAGKLRDPRPVCSVGKNASCQPPTSQLAARACSARQCTSSISGDEQDRDISEALPESH
jgi:hypothetical protein